MAIRQASCDVEIVPSLHSNLAGAASATGGGLAGGFAGAWAVWGAAAGAGACVTNFWKSAQPAHQTSISRARADRTCVASGDISAANRIGRLGQAGSPRLLQHTMAADDSDTSARRTGNLIARAAVLWSIHGNQVLPGETTW
jgi:hypothetical protein